MYVGISAERKRAYTKEPVDISSGKYEDSNHGFPIEEEGPEADSVEIGAPSTVSIKARVIEIEMPKESKKTFEKYTPDKLW